MNTNLKILIVEDEPLAAKQLATLLAKIRTNIQILEVCDTIESACQWIETNNAPDLAFFDIHLGDGLSFEIFSKTNFETPVIFTTAYDQYTLKAFKVNSIDYILKPVDLDELKRAMDKFERNHTRKAPSFNPDELKTLIHSIQKDNFKKRFLVKIGNKLKAINSSQISYFYSFQKGTYLKADNKDYLLDQTLEQIEQLVNPESFFRINRKYIVSLHAIQNVSIYSNSRLKLKVEYGNEDDFFVAREKVKPFKIWMEGD